MAVIFTIASSSSSPDVIDRLPMGCRRLAVGDATWGPGRWHLHNQGCVTEEILAASSHLIVEL